MFLDELPLKSNSIQHAEIWKAFPELSMLVHLYQGSHQDFESRSPKDIFGKK